MSERIRFIKHSLHKKNITYVLLALLCGCNNITQVDPNTVVSREVSNYTNSGDALIYSDNPSALLDSTYTNGSSSAKSFIANAYSKYLTRDFVTSNDYLETTCSLTQNISSTVQYEDTTSQNCFYVLNDDDPATQLLQSVSGSWKFDSDTDEFYQVNLFYHINKALSRYLDSLSFTHKQVHFNSDLKIPPSTKYNLVDTQSYWLTNNASTSSLRAYSKINMAAEDINAYFSPATNSLAFGYTEGAYDGFKFVQDPTVIYHEFGHVLVKIMMNQRNITNYLGAKTSHPYQSDLGTAFYDEAGAINEGVADYFSYYMTNRKKVGDWGFSIFQRGHRPLTEDDDIHTAQVSTNPGEKLSYPQYLYYNPSNSDVNEEDIHNAGMIVTHYLVNLQETLKSTCSFSSTDTTEIHQQAGNYIFLLLNETLAEIGDLTGKSSDLLSEKAGNNFAGYENTFFTNLNDEQSYLWAHFVNPPTFRKFFRIFGKNILYHISNDLCPEFTVDESEILLDEYGLLLFKSYEDAGNGYNTTTNTSQFFYSFVPPFNSGNEAWAFPGKELSPILSNTYVNENNRNQTVLVSKDFIKLDSDASAILFDGQEIATFLADLTFAGENVTTTSGIAGTEYNNKNVQIGPGEVIGLALNIFNNSNSPMAGVQVLANDWDHMRLKMDVDGVFDINDTYVNRVKNKSMINSPPTSAWDTSTWNTAIHEPCIINSFPTESEGGVTDTDSTVKGNCSSHSKDNSKLNFETTYNSINYPKHELDAPQPICLVQFSDENETKWVSQDYFRRHILDLEDSKCLNNPSMSGDDFNPNECMVRVLPGASTANLAKINAQSNWMDTIRDGDSSASVTYNYSALVVMEINKNIQPGTKMNCRFRTRISNCKDCFNSSSGVEFQDHQYTGAAPFKVIDYQFTVLK